MTPVHPAKNAEPAIQTHARTAARRHLVANAMELTASASVWRRDTWSTIYRETGHLPRRDA